MDDSQRKMPAIPTKDQILWQDMEVGMFIHWAPYVYLNPGPGEEFETYTPPVECVTTQNFDVSQWVQTAIDMEAKFIVFVAKHGGGFCMWPTETTPYSVKNISWKDGKGDVLKDISEECRRRGVRLGLYVCPQDLYLGADTASVCENEEKQLRHNALYRQQLTEVLTGYGDMCEMWFDGSTVCPVNDILEKHAPHAMIFQTPEPTIRWTGNEFGVAQYPAWNGIAEINHPQSPVGSDGTPDGKYWIPVEADLPIRGDFQWFWTPTNESTLKPVQQLMDIYYNTVGRGAVMLLNANPDREGRIPVADAVRARELGDMIRRLKSAVIAGTSGRGAVMELDFGEMRTVDHVFIDEDIAFGERIRAFTLEGCGGGGWEKLADGTAVGHRYIARFPAGRFSRLRFTADHYADTPIIKCFAACHADLPVEHCNTPPTLLDYRKVFEWGVEQFYGKGLEPKRFTIYFSDWFTESALMGKYEVKLLPGNGSVTILEAVLGKDGVAWSSTELVSAEILHLDIRETGDYRLDLTVQLDTKESNGAIYIRRMR